MPWVKQWHGEYDDQLGDVPADEYENQLRKHQVGVEELKAWRPVRKTRGRKRAEQLSRAQAADDKAGQLSVLNDRMQDLLKQAKTWQDLAQSYVEDRDKAQSEAADAKTLRQDRDYWEGQYLDLSKGGSG